jgi:hypothetical protein
VAPEGAIAAASSTGFFNVASEIIAGPWLRSWYFAGSLICFLGFYNAMAINAERTAFYFCEERFADKFNRWEASGRVGKFLFSMPESGGVRRVYIIVVAILEAIVAMTLDVGLLIELEMLVYALSASLFFYSFLYLRWQRTSKFRRNPAPPDLYPHEETTSLLKSEDRVSLDAEGQTMDTTVFEIGGGPVVALLMVLFPVTAFVANTFISVADEGDASAPFPYFKVACFAMIVVSGLVTDLACECGKK